MRQILILLAMAVMLAGCQARRTIHSPPPDPAPVIRRRAWAHAVPIRVELLDGREVHCVVHESLYGGGISCDWEGAR